MDGKPNQLPIPVRSRTPWGTAMCQEAVAEPPQQSSSSGGVVWTHSRLGEVVR